MTYMFRYEHKREGGVSAIVTADSEDEALETLNKVVVLLDEWDLIDSEEIDEDDGEEEE